MIASVWGSALAGGEFILEHTNIIVTGLTACAILYTRSAGVLYFTAGAVVCSLTVKFVKRFIRQPRPVHPLPGRQKKSYGMPSTHTAVITYYAAFSVLACAYLPIHPSLPQSELLRAIAPFVIVPWSVAIAVSRIWLGHHTLPQVLAGCVHGLVFTYMWFTIWVRYAAYYGQRFEHGYLAQ